jgi:hypothetical protein
VDGGAISQVFIYPSSLDLAAVLRRMEVHEPFNVYIIRNSKLKPTWEPVEPGIFRITAASISSLIRTQGLGDLSTIYLLTQRDGGNFRLTYVPDDFEVEPKEQFDPDYMNALYQVGYDMAKDGIEWRERPPATETIKVE